STWNPHRSTVRLAMGIGLWDASTGHYLLPAQTADATHPGGGGSAPKPAAFFNVAFRSDRQEPLPSPTAGLNAVVGARWWRDAAQRAALAAGTFSAFQANASSAKLARRTTDHTQVPRPG